MLVRNIIPIQKVVGPCPALACKPLASSRLVTKQAAGGRGQPGQLPHPAALLKNGAEKSEGWRVEINVKGITIECQSQSLLIFPAKNRFQPTLFHSFPIEERQSAVGVVLAQQTGQTGSEAYV